MGLYQRSLVLARPGGAAFVAILALDSLARATVSAIVPLQAYDLLGSAQQVSVLYFLTAATGLLGSLSVPWLVIRLRRRWMLSLESDAEVMVNGDG